MTTQISAKTLSLITHNRIPVITTELLAKLYGTTAHSITKNHRNNVERFIVGKHYYKVVGHELVNLRITLGDLQISPKTRSLILWTERGAARHAKMLETDQAWEVFEQLEDCYFNAERANNQPSYQPEARELLTAHDTSNLARLVWSMVNGFRFEKKWTQGIWYALRHATGVASPQHFEVNQIPILAEECSRIYSFTNSLKAAIFEAEKQAVRRVLRQREDADAVLSEMKQLLEASNQESSLLLTSTLTLWQQDGIQKFLQRH